MDYGEKFIIDGVEARYWRGCNIRHYLEEDLLHFKTEEGEEIVLKPRQFENMLKNNRIKKLER